MAQSMHRVPWLQTDMWGNDTFCGGRVHLGVQNPKPQPLVVRGTSIRVWFDGEMYLHPGGNGTTPSAEELTELVGHSGARLSTVDGVFALACFNPDMRELTLANDRLGFRPLYYAETREWFAYAAEVKSLLGILHKVPELDEISLRQFFSFDYMLGERTWWKGINLLPPAAVWHISMHGSKNMRYWNLGDIKRDVAKEEEVLPEFGRLWSQAIHERIKPGTMPFLLSGGLDSRFLLAELHAQGVDLATITFGSKDSPDMKIARKCAALAEVPHRPLYLTTDNWWHGREDTIWQTDGLVSGIHLHVAIARDEMHTGNMYTMKNSTGDTLFGGSKLKGNLSTEWKLSATSLLKEIYRDNPFFNEKEAGEVSLDDCRPYMSGPSSDCFVISQRQRRMILTGPLALSSYCEVVNPGISLGLLQLMLGSLSDHQRADSKFYNKFLITQYPTFFCNIPWQKTGRGLTESIHTRIGWNLRFRATGLLYSVPGGWRVADKLQVSNESFANYSYFVKVGKVREKLLREKLLADEFLKGAARRALNDQDCKLVNAETVIAILTFETYLRQVAGVPGLDAHAIT